MANNNFGTVHTAQPMHDVTAGSDAEKSNMESLSAASREKLDEFKSAAKEAATHATENLREQMIAQQSAGVEYAMHFAKNMRTAARSFDRDTPFVARFIDNAADYVEENAGKLRGSSGSDLLGSAKSFATRQPAAFLGLSLLAGFAVVRFLKASPGRPESKPAPIQDYSRPSSNANADF